MLRPYHDVYTVIMLFESQIYWHLCAKQRFFDKYSVIWFALIFYFYVPLYLYIGIFEMLRNQSVREVRAQSSLRGRPSSKMGTILWMRCLSTLPNTIYRELSAYDSLNVPLTPLLNTAVFYRQRHSNLWPFGICSYRFYLHIGYCGPFQVNEIGKNI